MLLERDLELAVLADAIDRARQGSGSLVLVEGPAGAGKTRLLGEAVQRADQFGLRCLQGRGAELEREMAFGVARQALAPALWELAAGDREPLLAGLAAGAGPLLGAAAPSPDPEPADQLALVDALYWLVYGLTHGAPGRARPSGALIAIDDAHWSDAATLRVLVRLATGLENLPVAIVVAMRSEELGREAAMTRLRSHPAARLLQPAPLSEQAVAMVVRRELGEDAAPELCRECAAVTGGNPFLLCELVTSLRVDQVAPTAEAAAAVSGMVPDSVLRSVLLRLARLPPAAGALAEAASVLGPDGSLRVGMGVAKLSGHDGESAADALVAAGILASSDPLRFAHPLIAAAVAADMPPLSIARARRRAAELLAADGAPDERVAAHLRLTSPAADPWVVAVLRSAASLALARGEALGAARLLERALAEPPTADERPTVLFELAEAEAAGGSPQALGHLAEARQASDDPQRRARALHAMSRLLFARGEVHAAVAAAEQGRAELEPDDPLAVRILASQLAVMFFVPGAWPEAERHLAELEAGLQAGRLPDDPLLLAQLATRCLWRCEPPGRVRLLAEAALAKTRDARQVWQGDASIASALVFVGEEELAESFLERMSAHAGRTGSPIHAAMAAHWRAALRYQQGWVADAAADAELVLGVHDQQWGFETMWAAAVLAQARLERADLDGARAAIDVGLKAETVHLPYGFLLHARGEVALAANDAEGALQDFTTAGAHLRDRYSLSNPAVVPWRRGAAVALVALGDRTRAAALADAELADARVTAVPHAVGGALRAAAAASQGTERITLLREAVEVLSPSPAQLEHARALCDLGAALRDGREGGAARQSLERALELARRFGARVTAERAYRELRLTGARPSPARERDQAVALTPGERRVAELAAQDLSNAEIAKRLFVTPRTVEWHLTQTYRKLGIRSRTGLGQALARAAAGAASATGSSYVKSERAFGPM